MIIVQDKLVSDDVAREHFLCNLNACKGACCWEGDAGAPLDADELPILEAIFSKIRPFLSPAGIAEIERQGTWVTHEDGSFGTPLIDNGPCAYMTTNALGIAHCGIEAAHKAGAVDWKKPISCHLYPIRVAKNEELGFEALNYDRWDICSAACELGRTEKLPVYQFLREAIVRKYGQDFYDELDGAAEFLKQQEAAD